jgi:hypothetical protein
MRQAKRAVPPLAGSLIRSQLGLVRALWWAARRREDVGRDDVVLRYNGLDQAVLWTIAVLGVLEIVVVHVLVSWPVLRWSLFAVGVYGLLAFLAFFRTMDQHPHLLRADGDLVLRFGHFRRARIPLDHLASVHRRVETAHENNVTVDGDHLLVAFLGQTNVDLRFAPDAVVDVEGREHAVSRVSFQVESPQTVTALLRARVRPR